MEQLYFDDIKKYIKNLQNKVTVGKNWLSNQIIKTSPWEVISCYIKKSLILTKFNKFYPLYFQQKNQQQQKKEEGGKGEEGKAREATPTETAEGDGGKCKPVYFYFSISILSKHWNFRILSAY